MKALPKKFLAFCAASAATAWAWTSLWPLPSASAKPGSPEAQAAETPRAEPKRWTPERIRAAIEACAMAKTKVEQMQAATELGKIPLENIKEALEAEPAVKDHMITLTAKILLIRWAGSDGEAAMKWAWGHFRPTAKYGTWREAFNEIGPAWAWHDAAGFYAFVSRQENLGLSEIAAAPEGEGDTPIFDFNQVSQICQWIAPEEPRLAYELMLRRGGRDSKDTEVSESFSLEQIKDALGAFPELADSPSGESLEKQLHAQVLLFRWQQLDPEDFARSPYAGLMKEDRNQIVLTTVDEWKAQAPGDRAATATRLVDGRRSKDGLQNVNAWGQLPVGANIIVLDCVSAIAGAWAGEDPAASLEWLETLPEAERDTGYRAIVAATAARDLNLAMAQVEKLPSAERMADTARAFWAWREAHPGQQPDTSGWSGQRIRAWEEWSFLTK